VTAAAPLVLLLDAQDDAAGLERTLSDGRWRVSRARTSVEALDRAKREQPAAIVVRGPVDDALQLVKKVRCCARTATQPVAVVAETADSAREELARWGVTAVLGAEAPDGQIADTVRKLAPLPPALQAPDAELGRPERLRALERAHLVDTPPEEPFDRLARFTAQLLDVPIVLMSIVDRQRQFFKAQVGLPSPANTTRQTPLSHSFCQWVVTANDDLVVDDARRHLVLCANKATIEAGIAAYAGVPLRADEDETIGSFCAVDVKPRHWDPQEIRALHDAADVARGLAAVRQAVRLPPVTFEEFREIARVTGRAVEAAVRLHEAGGSRVNTGERHALLELASELGRQLARVSERKA
jgi:hypothetical protein